METHQFGCYFKNTSKAIYFVIIRQRIPLSHGFSWEDSAVAADGNDPQYWGNDEEGGSMYFIAKQDVESCNSKFLPISLDIHTAI